MKKKIIKLFSLNFENIFITTKIFPLNCPPTACSTFDRLIIEIPTKRTKKTIESKRSHFELFNIKMNKEGTSQGDFIFGTRKKRPSEREKKKRLQLIYYMNFMVAPNVMPPNRHNTKLIV